MLVNELILNIKLTFLFRSSVEGSRIIMPSFSVSTFPCPLQGKISTFNVPASWLFKLTTFESVLFDIMYANDFGNIIAVPSWVGTSGLSKNGS